MDPVSEERTIADQGNAQEAPAAADGVVCQDETQSAAKSKSDQPGLPSETQKLESQEWNLERVGVALTDLAEKIESRALLIDHKNLIIDRQHEELKSYRDGMVQKLINPILIDLIRLHDDLTSLVQKLSVKVGLTAESVLKPFSTIPDDILDILNRSQAESFEELPGGLFEAARQKVVKRIPTVDPAADKTVAESVRPGFTWNGRVIRAQMVNVYVFSATAAAVEMEAVKAAQEDQAPCAGDALPAPD